MKKEKEIEGFIYLCKYKGEKAFIQVDGEQGLLVELLMNAMLQDELFIIALGELANDIDGPEPIKFTKDQ